MSTHPPNEARVIPLRPKPKPKPESHSQPRPAPPPGPAGSSSAPQRQVGVTPAPAGTREPLWRDLVGEVLRSQRLAQQRTLKDVAEAARISMPYLSELERGRKEGSSEVLAAAARALGLGLSDLLSLAQDELSRHSTATSRVGRGRTSSSPRYDGLCLAA